MLEVWERVHGLKIAFGGILTMSVSIPVFMSLISFSTKL